MYLWKGNSTGALSLWVEQGRSPGALSSQEPNSGPGVGRGRGLHLQLPRESLWRTLCSREPWQGPSQAENLGV